MFLLIMGPTKKLVGIFSLFEEECYIYKFFLQKNLQTCNVINAYIFWEACSEWLLVNKKVTLMIELDKNQ